MSKENIIEKKQNIKKKHYRNEEEIYKESIIEMKRKNLKKV